MKTSVFWHKFNGVSEVITAIIRATSKHPDEGGSKHL